MRTERKPLLIMLTSAFAVASCEMSPQARPRSRSAAAIIALALVAAACGSGESSAPVSAVIPGTDQLTDTGTDDTVSIEADGEITPSTPNVPVNDPNRSGIDPASLAVDRFLEVYNAQDAEEMAGVFGNDVVAFRRNHGQEMVGAGAARYWQGYFGIATGERITDPFHASDGRTYFLTEFGPGTKFATGGGGKRTLIFDVEMDGERLVSMGHRDQQVEEVIATGEIDRIYEAFNDQDVDRLTEEFEGLTYRSPAGVEVTGAEAAEHWADAFGSAVARTTGVFAIGDGQLEFRAEYRERDSDRSTAYVVEVEMSGGQIASMTERRPEN